MGRYKITQDKNKDDFMVIYSLCDKGKMPEELVSSLKSINRYIDRNNIIVFYTPPYSQRNYNIFNKYAIVKQVDNVTSPFKYIMGRAPSRYGEIIGHLEKISSSNVFILDCDTTIKKNIKELIDGDFDVVYRTASSWKNIDKQKWESLFMNHNKKPIPVPNKGFMFFKNNTHKKISKDFMKYMEMDLLHVSPYNYQKDQYALALAISGYKIKLWDKSIHAFEWLNERNVDTYVLHERPLNWFSKITFKLLWKIKRRVTSSRIKQQRKSISDQ